MLQHDKVGKELKEYFKQKGITQEQIAERVGTTQQVVGRLLNGKAFGKKTAIAWSEAFGLNASYLITGEGKMLESDNNAAFNTAKKVVDAGAEIFADKILQLINSGELYPASIIKEKNREIASKDEEIQRLNRELGALTQELERLSNELKRDAAQTESA